MKRLLLALMMFSSLCNAQVSKMEAIKLFDKLVKIAKIKNKPSFKIVQEKDFNGYTSVEGIKITTGMLNLTTKAELAGVIGHELTHWMYKDHEHFHIGFGTELRADSIGMQLAEKLGYGQCAIVHFMKKALKKDGEDGGDGVHPGWSYRWNALRGNCPP